MAVGMHYPCQNLRRAYLPNPRKIISLETRTVFFATNMVFSLLLSYCLLWQMLAYALLKFGLFEKNLKLFDLLLLAVVN